MASLSYPMFITFGAGKPSITGDHGGNPGTNDIAGIVAMGCAGLRMGIDWSAANPSFDGVTLNTNYMNSIKTIVQYCNARTLLSGAVPVTAGYPGLAIDLQLALGSNFNSRGYDTNVGGINVPRNFAIFGATVVDYFKKVGASYPNGRIYCYEAGNEPNHQKWSDSTLDGGVYKDRASWLAAGSPAIGYKALSYVKTLALWSALARVIDPTAKLVLGGLGGHSDKGASDTPPWTFYQDMYDARFSSGGFTDPIGVVHNAPKGVHGLVDYANFHPYCYPLTPTEDLAGPNPTSGHSGWAAMVLLLFPILASGGGHADATDEDLPIIITEFGYPNPAANTTIGQACAGLVDACRLWDGYPQGGQIGGIMSPFCWQDKDEVGPPPADPAKNRWYGFVGVGKNQWAGDTTAYGKKQNSTGNYWQTYHDLATGVYNFGTAPSVSSLTVTSGPPAGGTDVTIRGANLTGATAVKFGTVSVAAFTVVSKTKITTTSPAGAGVVDVTVTVAGVTSPTSANDQFTYTAAVGAPTVTSIAPDNGPSGGGTGVLVTGTNFTGTTGVKFGTNDATFGFVTPTSLAAGAPAGTGDQRVSVANPSGTSTDDVLYTYNPPASANLMNGVGFSPSSTQTLLDRQMDRVVDLSLGFVRCDVQWDTIQPSSQGYTGTAGKNTAYDWTKVNQVLDACNARSLRWLIMFGYSPTWGCGNSDDKTGPTRDPVNLFPDYANAAWAVVNHCETRNPGILYGIEIWNEPNTVQFFHKISGAGRPVLDAAGYFTMLRGAHQAIKTGIVGLATAPVVTRTPAYPNVTVISGGMAPPANGATDSEPRQWIKQFAPNGATDAFDAVAIHAYCWEYGPLYDATWNVFKETQEVRDTLVSIGREDAIVWNTETGMSTRPDDSGTDPRTGSRNGGYDGTPGHVPPPPAYLTDKLEITYTLGAQRVPEIDAAWKAYKDTHNAAGTLQRWSGPTAWFGLESTLPNLHGSGAWNGNYGCWEYSAQHQGAEKKPAGWPTVPSMRDNIRSLAGSDTTAPSVQIIGPTTGTLSGTVIFAILTTDDTDTDGNLTLSFFVDGTKKTVVTTYTPDAKIPFGFNWTVELNTTALTDASHGFVAKSRDSSLNLGTSATVTLPVDNSTPTDDPPAISAVTPASGSTLSGTVTLQSTVTDDNDTSVTVQFWEGTPAIPGAYGTNLLVSPTGGQYATQVPDTTTYRLDWDTTSISNGSHEVHAVATDTSGNVTVGP